MKKIRQISEEAQRIEEGMAGRLGGAAILAGAMISHGGTGHAATGYQNVMNNKEQAADVLDTSAKISKLSGEERRKALEFEKRHNFGKAANQRKPNPFVK